MAKSRKKRPRSISRTDPVDPAAPVAHRPAGRAHSITRNRSAKAGRKASFVLEDSQTGRPSRKSTRRAKNRVKPDSNLRRRQVRRDRSPENRARKASVAKR